MEFLIQVGQAAKNYYFTKSLCNINFYKQPLNSSIFKQFNN